jgi:hypothetical protein
VNTTAERPMAEKKRDGKAGTDNVRVPADFNDMMVALAKDSGFKSVAAWLKSTDFYEWVTREYKALLKRKLAEMEKGKAKDPPPRS